MTFFCCIRTANSFCLSQLTISRSGLTCPQSCLLIRSLWRLSTDAQLDDTVSRWCCVFRLSCLGRLGNIDARVLKAICLARSSVAQPPITNETTLSNSVAKLNQLPYPHNRYPAYHTTFKERWHSYICRQVGRIKNCNNPYYHFGVLSWNISRRARNLLLVHIFQSLHFWGDHVQTSWLPFTTLFILINTMKRTSFSLTKYLFK